MEEKLEYYAGASVTRTKSNKKDKDKTSDETWFVLIIASTLTILVTLITLFHVLADRCRNADLLKNDE